MNYKHQEEEEEEEEYMLFHYALACTVLID